MSLYGPLILEKRIAFLKIKEAMIDLIEKVQNANKSFCEDYFHDSSCVIQNNKIPKTFMA